ncbi:MAG TPA: N-acetyl-gamma-glutamyl-phosphate reductase, partial [Kiloniellaceae bacterium]|nr:N-acetyl-gamma-glutamyl-phosphate reductase [Kiloniellaceae bacterium]
MTEKIRIGVLGASGYTGADLVRLLACHPKADLRTLTANAHAGKSLASVYPHLGGLALPDLLKVEEAEWSGLDLVFCGLPHGTTQEIIAGLPGDVKVIDLSADFRLRDIETYAQWYGHPHRAPDLQETA